MKKLNNKKDNDAKYILFFISIISGVFIICMSISLFLYYAFFKSFKFLDFVNNTLEINKNESNYLPTETKASVVKVVNTRKNNTKEINTNKTTSNVFVKSPKSVTNNNTNIKTNTNTIIKPTCYQYVLGDPFNVTKCYLYNDYSKLISAYDGYRRNTKTINDIKSSIKITCNGTDLSKLSCDKNKKSLKDVENRKNEYENKILSIIPKGK